MSAEREGDSSQLPFRILGVVVEPLFDLHPEQSTNKNDETEYIRNPEFFRYRFFAIEKPLSAAKVKSKR